MATVAKPYTLRLHGTLHLSQCILLWIRSLGWEDPLEKEMETHSSSLACTMPWTEEPGGYLLWGHAKSDMLKQLSVHAFLLFVENKFNMS